MQTQHIDEIKEILAEYSEIKKALEKLEEQTNLLNLQKMKIEMDLARVREAESSLIDKIKLETGEEVDYYEILKQLN